MSPAFPGGKILVLFLLASVALAGGSRATAAPVVEVALSSDDLTVGDRTEATLTLALPSGAALAGDPRFPAWGKTWGDAEVVEAGAVVKEAAPDGRTLYRQKVVLAAFAPGKIPLPQVEVAVPYEDRTEKASTPPGLALGVRSVLPAAQEGQEPEPKPADPPRPLPVGSAFWWTLAAAALVLAALAWLVWRRKGAAAAAADLPQLPPLPELLAALDRLSGSAPVALHTGLSLALRRYLGRLLAFSAVESTTGEIRRQLAARRVPGRLAQTSLELLSSCDLVKFAKKQESAEKGRERLEAAHRLASELDAWHQPSIAAAVENAAAGPPTPALEAAR